MQRNNPRIPAVISFARTTRQFRRGTCPRPRVRAGNDGGNGNVSYTDEYDFDWGWIGRAPHARVWAERDERPRKPGLEYGPAVYVPRFARRHRRGKARRTGHSQGLFATRQ